MQNLVEWYHKHYLGVLSTLCALVIGVILLPWIFLGSPEVIDYRDGQDSREYMQAAQRLGAAFAQLQEEGKLTLKTGPQALVEYVKPASIDTYTKMQGQKTVDFGRNSVLNCSAKYPCMVMQNGTYIQYYVHDSFDRSQQRMILFQVDTDGPGLRHGVVTYEQRYDGFFGVFQSPWEGFLPRWDELPRGMKKSVPSQLRY